MDRFAKITTLVIDMLEGGYFHPDMFKDGRLSKKYEGVFAISGETMFGIDRKNYGTADKYFKSFWQLIDASGARYSWKYNYRGGKAETTLKKFVVEMMRARFNNYAKQFLSDKARGIISADDRLTFHMSYAVWNGAGHFQKFAKKLNDAVNTTKNTDQLWRIAMQSRYDVKDKYGLFAKSADKMKAHFGDSNTATKASGGILVGLFGLIGIAGGYFTAKKIKH